MVMLSKSLRSVCIILTIMSLSACKEKDQAEHQIPPTVPIQQVETPTSETPTSGESPISIVIPVANEKLEAIEAAIEKARLAHEKIQKLTSEKCEHGLVYPPITPPLSPERQKELDKELEIAKAEFNAAVEEYANAAAAYTEETGLAAPELGAFYLVC